MIFQPILLSTKLSVSTPSTSVEHQLMLRRIFPARSCSRALETTVSSNIFPLDTTTGGLVTLNNPCRSIKIADPSLPLTKRVEESRPWAGAGYRRKREAEREGEET